VRALDHSELAGSIADLLTTRAPQDQELRTLLEHRAEEGNATAALVLALVGVEHPAAVRYAEERVSAFLARPPHADPAMIEIGTNVTLMGGLARLLNAERRDAVATHLLAFAEASTDVELNRGSALLGLYKLSDRLPDERRDILSAGLAFALGMAICEGQRF